MLVATLLSVQSSLSFNKLLVQLDLFEPQHAPYLIWRQILVHQERDLLQGQAHIFHGQYTVQPGELAGRIVAIARKLINPCRFEQSKFIVIAQSFDRYLTQSKKSLLS